MASSRVGHEQTYQKLKWLSRRMFAVTVPQVSLAAKLAAAESDKQELVAQLAQAQVGVGQESRGGGVRSVVASLLPLLLCSSPHHLRACAVVAVFSGYRRTTGVV